jgi:FMN reductase
MPPTASSAQSAGVPPLRHRARELTIVGLGGSLASISTSLAALEIALEGARDAGARPQLLDIRELDLPMYNPDDEAPVGATPAMVELCYAADGFLWSSPMYQGTISGSLKNALDWLRILHDREPPYLHDKVIGLISVAGGTQGLQVINTMQFSVRALRGWAVPYVVAVPSSRSIFDRNGQILDAAVELQLRALGAEVVRVARRFAADPSVQRDDECEKAALRVAAITPSDPALLAQGA